MMKRSLLVVCLVVTVCLTLSAGIPPASGAYPDKSITLVCWSKPGSSVDLMARAVAKFSDKYVGQSMRVLTKSGGGGTVALAYVKKQKADGYTLQAGTRSYAVLMAWGRAKNLTPDDFIPLTRLIREPMIFAVNAKRPYSTWQAFVDYAKKNPNKIKVAVPYIGQLHHTVFLMVKNAAGIKTVDVPHEGGRPAITSAVGGHDDSVFNNPSVMKTPIRENKLKPLFCSGSERMKEFPDVPTLKELGIDIEEYHWRGVMVKAGMPQDRMKHLADAFKQMTQEAEWKQLLQKFMWEPGFMPPEEFGPYVDKQIKSFKKVLLEEGLIKK